MEKQLNVGDPIVYVDQYGVKHAALVTRVWVSVGNLPGCNAVWVSGDESKTDQYGRQIDRNTSIIHMSQQPAHGGYWRLPAEEGKPTER